MQHFSEAKVPAGTKERKLQNSLRSVQREGKGSEETAAKNSDQTLRQSNRIDFRRSWRIVRNLSKMHYIRYHLKTFYQISLSLDLINKFFLQLCTQSSGKKVTKERKRLSVFVTFKDNSWLIPLTVFQVWTHTKLTDKNWATTRLLIFLVWILLLENIKQFGDFV